MYRNIDLGNLILFFSGRSEREKETFVYQFRQTLQQFQIECNGVKQVRVQDFRN